LVTSVTIPTSVTAIGSYAFANITTLASVTFLSPTPPVHIEENVFFGSINLASIIVPLDAVADYLRELPTELHGFISHFGVNPPTGIYNITWMMVLMLAFAVASAVLWGLVLRRKSCMRSNA
jgi:hypothetical protein